MMVSKLLSSSTNAEGGGHGFNELASEELVYSEGEWDIVEKPLVWLQTGALDDLDERYGQKIRIDWPEHRFEHFPKLPVELRNAIWKLALPGPRILQMAIDELPEDDIPMPAVQSNRPQLWTPENWVHQFLQVAEPIRLHVHVYSDSDECFFNLVLVCKESYAVFQSAYSTLEFRHSGTDLPWAEVKNKELREQADGRMVRIVPGKWRIDYKRDTLELDGGFLDDLESYDSSVDLTQVQNVVFCLTRELSCVPSRQLPPNATAWLWGFLADQCASLKTLTFSLGQIRHGSCNGYESSCTMIKMEDQTLKLMIPYLKASLRGLCDANKKAEAAMKTAKELGQRARKRFEVGIAAHGSLKPVKFEVAFASTHERRINEPDRLWVAPKISSHYGISFWVQRPAATYLHAGHQIFHALGVFANCHADGSLIERKKKG